MKLQFKHQQFQTDAAQKVIDAFAGQPYYNRAEYIMNMGLRSGDIPFTQIGFGNNPLVLNSHEIASNIRSLQMVQDIKPIDALEGEGVQLTIEMETGTGKTYTYIKTMYELNRQYGWSKFIIIVPSIAIREGVQKSFQVMSDHFAAEYEGKRIQHFIYNSKQLSKIQAFADDDKLHVMIINTQAFNSSFNETNKRNEAARIIFSKRDDFGSRRPIDVLAKTNPIVIIDEPQRASGTATVKAISQFNPLFVLRYSATHRQVLNMVYRLDAIDAYNQHLVKKIEVKGIHQQGSTATNGYVYLEEILIGKGNPQARLHFDMGTTSGTKQVNRLVGEGFNLYEQSGHLQEYKNHFVVESIDGRKGTVRFLNGIELHQGEAVGKVSEAVMRRTQIRETIKSHIERERRLFAKGIKVLSLFFIDHVDNYRIYGGSSSSKGSYAQMFEEEYTHVIEELQPTLFDDTAYLDYLKKSRAQEVHNGYFSRDKQGNFIDSKEKKGEGGSDDQSAYDLIMKDKERLLSFEEPTRFIFSHSTLRKRSDNPNRWYNTTLAWMSYGYETQIPPIYTLAFFNAIANGGRYMRPYFVSEIRRRDSLTQHIEPKVLKERICKPETLQAIQEMLRRVVTEGTGKKARSAYVAISGKSGTAQLSGKHGYRDSLGQVRHQVSFCAYFPSEAPRYSCIAVIRAPSPRYSAGGGVMAAPIIRRIAESLVALEKPRPLDSLPRSASPLAYTRHIAAGRTEPLLELLEQMGLPAPQLGAKAPAYIRIDSAARISALPLATQGIPDLRGMSAMDAVYLLRSRGYRVQLIGG